MGSRTQVSASHRECPPSCPSRSRLDPVSGASPATLWSRLELEGQLRGGVPPAADPRRGPGSPASSTPGPLRVGFPTRMQCSPGDPSRSSFQPTPSEAQSPHLWNGSRRPGLRASREGYVGLRPFRSPALQPGPCHGCRGTCKDDLPLPVSPTTRAELLGTGVQVAHLKPFWSLGSWLPNKVVWGSGGGGGGCQVGFTLEAGGGFVPAPGLSEPQP